MTNNDRQNDKYGCTNVDIDHTNWREEYKNYTTSKYQLELLENGAKSLSQRWILAALYQKWKKMKGIKDEVIENEGQLQSSFKEWNENL